MTPQIQAEQKARELRKSLQFKDHPFNAHARQIGDVAEQELTTLFQKADALDWLDHTAKTDITGKSNKSLVLDFQWDDEEQTLLSAIQQAQKEQG